MATLLIFSEDGFSDHANVPDYIAKFLITQLESLTMEGRLSVELVDEKNYQITFVPNVVHEAIEDAKRHSTTQ